MADVLPDLKFHIHTETLIKAIKRRPCLWNRSLPEYKDKASRSIAWTEICREIEPNYETFLAAVKKEFGLQINKKWCNIRDAYVKARSNYRHNKCSKPYIYSKELKFIDPHIIERDRPDVLEERLESDEDNENWFSETVYLEDEPTVKKPKVEIEVGGPETGFLESDNIVMMLTKMIQKEEDEDRAFFKSIEPSVKALSEVSKLEFRIQVLKMIKELKIRERTGIQVNLKMTVDDEQ